MKNHSLFNGLTDEEKIITRHLFSENPSERHLVAYFVHPKATPASINLATFSDAFVQMCFQSNYNEPLIFLLLEDQNHYKFQLQPWMVDTILSLPEELAKAACGHPDFLKIPLTPAIKAYSLKHDLSWFIHHPDYFLTAQEIDWLDVVSDANLLSKMFLLDRVEEFLPKEKMRYIFQEGGDYLSKLAALHPHFNATRDDAVSLAAGAAWIYARDDLSYTNEELNDIFQTHHLKNNRFLNEKVFQAIAMNPCFIPTPQNLDIGLQFFADDFSPHFTRQLEQIKIANYFVFKNPVAMIFAKTAAHWQQRAEHQELLTLYPQTKGARRAL